MQSVMCYILGIIQKKTQHDEHNHGYKTGHCLFLLTIQQEGCMLQADSPQNRCGFRDILLKRGWCTEFWGTLLEH